MELETVEDVMESELTVSDPWGEIKCPDCPLIVYIHENGWHLANKPENQDFTALEVFVAEHTSSHKGEGA